MSQITELRPVHEPHAASRVRRIIESGYPLRAAGVRAAQAAAGCTVAFVSLWDGGRRRVFRAAGFELPQMSEHAPLCESVVRSGEMVVATNAVDDPRFANDDLVRHLPRLRAYVGVPIVLGAGDVVGTLAIGDRRTRVFDDASIDALEELARVIAEDLEWMEHAGVAVPTTSAALHAGHLEEHLRRDEARQNLLAAVSHELRTPLSVLVGGAATLGRIAELPGPLESLVSSMQDHGKRLEVLIDDILQVLDATADDTDPLVAVPIRRLIETTVWEVVPQGEVAIDAPDVTVRVDANGLRRAVLHLVDNARRHTPEGTRVEVRVRAVEGHLELTVSDDGPGIPPKLREAVLRPFAQGLVGDPSNPGLGIGLALVRVLACRAGGQINVGPSGGGGTEVRIVLPTEDPAEGGPAGEAPLL